MTRVFAATLVNADHIRSFDIRAAFPNGWQVQERVDDRVVHQRYLSDWHRVERNVSQFVREIADLRSRGWSVVEAV
ncbi:MAG TPA: hypothetical protein VFA59_03550 [Vicinamibacterales bacterium]|nr:hypothetical protein [Vicinamibacterales bacterium]